MKELFLIQCMISYRAVRDKRMELTRKSLLLQKTSLKTAD
jgi:hypothetical protein